MSSSFYTSNKIRHDRTDRSSQASTGPTRRHIPSSDDTSDFLDRTRGDFVPSDFLHHGVSQPSDHFVRHGGLRPSDHVVGAHQAQNTRPRDSAAARHRCPAYRTLPAHLEPLAERFMRDPRRFAGEVKSLSRPDFVTLLLFSKQYQNWCLGNHITSYDDTQWECRENASAGRELRFSLAASRDLKLAEIRVRLEQAKLVAEILGVETVLSTEVRRQLRDLNRNNKS